MTVAVVAANAAVAAAAVATVAVATAAVAVVVAVVVAVAAVAVAVVLTCLKVRTISCTADHKRESVYRAKHPYEWLKPSTNYRLRSRM